MPSQIHLDNEQLNDMGDEEDTILSSDGLGGGRGGNNASVAGPGVLKRVVSIEKFRGSVNSVSVIFVGLFICYDVASWLLSF